MILEASFFQIVPNFEKKMSTKLKRSFSSSACSVKYFPTFKSLNYLTDLGMPKTYYVEIDIRGGTPPIGL